MPKSLVKVVWIDAEDHSDTWVDEQSAEDFANAACQIISVGFLVSKGKYATLAGDWDESSKNYGRLTKIPVAWILDLVELHPMPQPEPDAQ